MNEKSIAKSDAKQVKSFALVTMHLLQVLTLIDMCILPYHISLKKSIQPLQKKIIITQENVFSLEKPEVL